MIFPSSLNRQQWSARQHTCYVAGFWEGRRVTKLARTILLTEGFTSIWQASLHPLEFLDFKVVLFQQLIKVSAIFTGKLCGLTHVAFSHGKHLNQIVSFKCVSCIF